MGGRDAERPQPSERPTPEVVADADRPGSWLLVAGGTPQSHVDLDDPTHLDFEYMRRFGHITDLAAPRGRAITALHLGAGALTLARYIAATRPGSRQRAVDNDAGLIELVRARLPWNRRADIRVGIGEAREWLTQRGSGTADLLVSDVFAGARTPAPVTSSEFHNEAARVLRPGGLFAANIGDGYRLRHTRAQVTTAAAAFTELALIAEPRVLRGRRFGNLILVACDQPLPISELSRRSHHDPDMARLLSGEELQRFTAGSAQVHDAEARDSPPPPEDVFSR